MWWSALIKLCVMMCLLSVCQLLENYTFWLKRGAAIKGKMWYLRCHLFNFDKTCRDFGSVFQLLNIILISLVDILPFKVSVAYFLV